MLNEEVIDKVIERIVNRIEHGNSYVLKRIGKSIKKIGTLDPTSAHQLVQILRYGGDYDEIIKELAKITELNVKDIEKIFHEIAKNDYNFAKQFYDYRGIKFIPYDENMQLQRQVQAIANITTNEYLNISRTLGFTKKVNGKIVFTDLSRTYQQTLDEAILNVSQGKNTFQEQMYKIIKELGSSGLKTVDYSTNRHMRLDSAVRMSLKQGLRELHNETQKIIGEEIDADGIEVSVHQNPADDHAEVQGRQFSNEEFNKFQNNIDAVDYQGKLFTAEFEGHDRRSISEYNCYHYIFSIILGVNKPQYTNKQLNEIIKNNNKGFKFEGKHYSMYKGTQLQRSIELAIRKQKDIQIIAKSSGNDSLVRESQQKITTLTRKYKELSNVSGLPTKMERMRVSGYKRTKINNYKEIEYARKNKSIWHSTESLEKMINDDKIISPSIAIGNGINAKARYGTQFIEFKPEFLENVDKKTVLYNGDGGNEFSQKAPQFDNLMEMLKNKPDIYDELKFNKDLKLLKYIKKVYIRDDEPQRVINLLEENGIDYQIYKDRRIRNSKKR